MNTPPVDPPPPVLPEASSTEPELALQTLPCDRCGAAMVERGCKIICLNCGNRFDCSDLSIYLD